MYFHISTIQISMDILKTAPAVKSIRLDTYLYIYISNLFKLFTFKKYWCVLIDVIRDCHILISSGGEVLIIVGLVSRIGLAQIQADPQ